MNQKQTKIFEAYKDISNNCYEMCEAKNQDDFLMRLGRLQDAVRKMRRLECRGVEQYEYNLGLSSNEFKELISEIIDWNSGH